MEGTLLMLINHQLKPEKSLLRPASYCSPAGSSLHFFLQSTRQACSSERRVTAISHSWLRSSFDIAVALQSRNNVLRFLGFQLSKQSEENMYPLLQSIWKYGKKQTKKNVRVRQSWDLVRSHCRMNDIKAQTFSATLSGKIIYASAFDYGNQPKMQRHYHHHHHPLVQIPNRSYADMLPNELVVLSQHGSLLAHLYKSQHSSRLLLSLWQRHIKRCIKYEQNTLNPAM